MAWVKMQNVIMYRGTTMSVNVNFIHSNLYIKNTNIHLQDKQKINKIFLFCRGLRLPFTYLVLEASKCLINETKQNTDNKHITSISLPCINIKK